MSTRILSALLSLSLITTIATGDVRADEPQARKDEASQRFKSGVAFYNDKDFTAAMVEFKRAYELVPNHAVLFNIGQTARELKDYAAALAAFERYLNDGGARIDPKRKGAVSASIEELRRKVGKVKISTNVEGAEVAIDDTPVGAAPLAEPVVVNVGRRKLSASKSGYTPAQRMVEIAGMAETTVALELVKVEVLTPGDAPRDPPPPAKTEIPLSFWVTLSATGAAAIAAGVTGGLALSARGGLEDALATFPGNARAIADAQSKTRALAITTDVLTGVAVAGAVTTTLLFFLAPRGAPTVPPKDKPTATIDVSPAGFSVRGVF